MKFIEMTGHALMSMIEPDEVSPEKLQQVGLTDTCLFESKNKVMWRYADMTDGILSEALLVVSHNGRACRWTYVGLKSVESSALYGDGRDENIDYTIWPAYSLAGKSPTQLES